MIDKECNVYWCFFGERHDDLLAVSFIQTLTGLISTTDDARWILASETDSVENMNHLNNLANVISYSGIDIANGDEDFLAFIKNRTPRSTGNSKKFELFFENPENRKNFVAIDTEQVDNYDYDISQEGLDERDDAMLDNILNITDKLIKEGCKHNFIFINVGSDHIIDSEFERETLYHKAMKYSKEHPKKNISIEAKIPVRFESKEVGLSAGYEQKFLPSSFSPNDYTVKFPKEMFVYLGKDSEKTEAEKFIKKCLMNEKKPPKYQLSSRSQEI